MFAPSLNLDYKNPVNRALDRLEASFAEASGVVDGTKTDGSNSTTGNIGFGVRDMVLADGNGYGDPRFDPDYQRDADAALKSLLADKKSPVYNKFLSDWADKHKQGYAITMGAAFDLTTTTGDYSNLKWNGYEGWATALEGFTVNSFPIEVIEYGTYRNDEYVVTKGVGSHENISNLGFQIPVGKSAAKGIDGYFGFSEQWKQLSGSGTSGSPVFSVGVEVQLSRFWGGFGSAWLQLGWSSKGMTTGSSLFGTAIRFSSTTKSANGS
jgi:hypothetical protein